jgi:hypothetical protein
MMPASVRTEVQSNAQGVDLTRHSHSIVPGGLDVMS